MHLAIDLQDLDLAWLLKLRLQPGHLLYLQRRLPRRFPADPDDEATGLFRMLLQRLRPQFRLHRKLFCREQSQPPKSAKSLKRDSSRERFRKQIALASELRTLPLNFTGDCVTCPPNNLSRCHRGHLVLNNSNLRQSI